jgi:predicted  nucleic acid-binding Zn-ribbon protein
MEQDLIEQLGQRIDALIADRNQLRAEVERLQLEGGTRNQELEAELELARAELEAARADLQAARAEVQERDARIQAASSRVQALIDRLQAD